MGREGYERLGQESISSYGSVTAPGSGAAIVTLTTPAAGTYLVKVQAIFSTGTPAAAEDGNFVIRRAAAAQKRLATARVTGQQFNADIVLAVDGTQDISVNTNGAATAGVVYSASISIQKLN